MRHMRVPVVARSAMDRLLEVGDAEIIGDTLVILITDRGLVQEIEDKANFARLDKLEIVTHDFPDAETSKATLEARILRGRTRKM